MGHCTNRSNTGKFPPAVVFDTGRTVSKSKLCPGVGRQREGPCQNLHNCGRNFLQSKTIPDGSHRYNYLKLQIFGLILPCPFRYRHDSGQELHKFSSGYMYKKIRKKKSVLCFPDFFIAVVVLGLEIFFFDVWFFLTKIFINIQNTEYDYNIFVEFSFQCVSLLCINVI